MPKQKPGGQRGDQFAVYNGDEADVKKIEKKIYNEFHREGLRQRLIDRYGSVTIHFEGGSGIYMIGNQTIKEMKKLLVEKGGYRNPDIIRCGRVLADNFLVRDLDDQTVAVRDD